MPEPPPARFRKREQSAAQSFNFGADVRDLLRSLADEMGVSQVAVLELAIRRLARRHASGDDSAPAEQRTPSPAGVPQSFRLTDVGRQLLRQLAEEPSAQFGATQVEVMERAVRRFAQFAAREGFIEGAPRSRVR
jgi:hypothetical protein